MDNYESTSAKNEFLKFIKYIEKSYKPWYTKSVSRTLKLWYVCQFLSILCGFAATVIAAISSEEFFNVTGKILLMVIPSIGSLAATIILQFRIFDLWQLRENARVSIEKMISTGLQLYASNKTETEYSELHKAFIEQIYNLEADQKTQFFQLSSANSILKFEQQKLSIHK
jgi:ABC-type dipeptide/oligopeptide/nickel transport system permease component